MQTPSHSIALGPRAPGRRRFLLASLLASAGLFAMPGHAHAQTSVETAPRGTAIVIGGALKYDNDAVWKRIVDEAGGPGARFAVFATAAANPERSAGQIIEALQRQGARAEHIPVAPRLAGSDVTASVRDPALLAKVNAAQGVFFSGGAQELIVDSLQPGGQPTPMLDAIWSLYRRGGVVAGSSAGAAIMSSTMFRDAQDSLKVLKGQLRRGQEVDRGLGFVGPHLFIDQHFLKRGRIGRLLPLMQAEGYRLGLGVEENSAAVIKGESLEVIGARGVLLVDLSEASRDARLPAFNIRGVRLSFLDRGDRHHLGSGETTPSAAKRAGHKIDPRAPNFKPFFTQQPFLMDMLGDNTIANAMAQLIDSPFPDLLGLAFAGPRSVPASASAASATGSEPDSELGFEFRLYKGPDSLAWFTGTMGGEDYTVLNLRLDVLPVRVQQPFYKAISPIP
ncbi:cyanophycinase [Paucibacter sp. DJ1R-11]|uniref:cyanophycinase n=1 Tax=Paucibacter sp. DJ1R-11 TaxID=2893556 RepID=UPI0021E4F07E|nr:cyanophycinase [Paucibacter sp. DJ1R-11]MCV2363900.1 cyanophycinase [Paucibacter sp. DJ1R-11]